MRPRMMMTALAALTAGAMSAAACGDDGGGAIALDPCALVTRDDAEEFLQERVGEPERSDDPDGWTTCTYVGRDTGTPRLGSVTISLKDGVGNQQFQKELDQVASKQGLDAEYLHGLGDAGYSVGTNLFVHEGGLSLTVAVALPHSLDNPGLAEGGELARRAIDRLDGDVDYGGEVDPCELLTSNDVAEIIGGPVMEPVRSGYGWSSCTFSPESQRDVTFAQREVLNVDASAGIFSEEFNDRKAKQEEFLGVEATEIDGLGDDAYSLGRGLSVRQGDVVIGLGASPSLASASTDEEVVDLLVELARIALDRLD